ncbi:hypothetical protein MVEN_00427100 [Mycena venus]|uniref:Uncharacterized protein n=1 Tax=Mycena venus TaxID=2733690 RepID=A0A8H6YVN7_9AGAR|nr:hypothetical protein MVEN_00427100 [Mycena venus]
MALTQSARLPGAPSWDDEVVPALRKRLEGESRVLSKRISAAVSISSIEDTEPSYQPRPSLTQPRSSIDRNQPPRIVKANGATSSKQRARTYSQPKLSEIPTRSPDPSPRAQYQYSEPKPTRIPKVARGRTGSISGKSNGRTTPQSPPTDSSDVRRLNDGLLAPEKLAKQPSQDTIRIPIRQTSGLLNEPAPFMPGPESTNSHDETPPRPSNDSEERPFEHWYRGEVSRNGGVGELKLGKRAEMLEIANYGHTLKQKQALREAEASNQRRRKRSESSAGIEAHRESLYLDDDHANNVGRVLDEGPLTDVDAEMSDGDYYNQQYRQHDTSTSSAPLPDYRQYGSTTPTPTQTPRQQQGTRIPSPRATTPTPAPPMQRGQSEPLSLPASSSLSQASRQLQNNSKRAATASPPAASSSASKKPRAAVTPKPKPKTQAKRANTVADDKNRRSVAYYPSPGDDDEEDLADAIPTWTQPVKPQTGRWDDWHGRKGWTGMYEKADGSPKPKKEEGPVEPAAGTFGWDHSKYRPPRDDNGIQMDEFGRPVDNNMTMEEEERLAFGHRPLYPPTEHEQQPAPKDVINTVDLDQLKYGNKQQQQQQPEDDGGAGCCKCIVM